MNFLCTLSVFTHILKHSHKETEAGEKVILNIVQFDCLLSYLLIFELNAKQLHLACNFDLVSVCS